LKVFPGLESPPSHITAFNADGIDGYLYIAESSGSLYRLPFETKDDDPPQLELIGCVDGGIASFYWSPDGECVILVTGKSTFVLLNRDLEPVKEMSLLDDAQTDHTLIHSVSVGWGSVETQFTRPGEKALQRHGQDLEESLVSLSISAALSSKEDDGQVRVSWRGDSSKFVVSHIHSQSRELRIYNRDAELLCVAEPMSGLEQSVAWRPSGNLIASTVGGSVVFFEPNGLRHGEFFLVYDKENSFYVRELAWNADSTILAIYLMRSQQHGTPLSLLQLWTMSNYHYDLKQTFPFYSEDGECSSFKWDVSDPTTLRYIRGKARFGCLRVVPEIWRQESKWQMQEAGNCSLVAVAHGSFLRLTPLMYSSVPPPMCAHELSLLSNESRAANSTVRHVALHPTHPLILILTSCSSLFLYHFDMTKRPFTTKLLCSLPLSTSIVLKQALWSSSSSLSFHVLATQYHMSDVLLCGSVDSTYSMSITEQIPLPSCIRILEVDTEPFLILVCPDGTLQHLSLSDHYHIQPFLPLPRLPCITPFVTPLTSHSVLSHSLNDRRLFLNGRLLVSGITSFLVHPSHFLIVTCIESSDQWIRFYHLKTLLASKEDSFTLHTDSRRRLEQGGSLVQVLADSACLVLQMPRGNLELVYPRPLVLLQVLDYLSK
jgi:elongator complex protein 1